VNFSTSARQIPFFTSRYRMSKFELQQGDGSRAEPIFEICLVADCNNARNGCHGVVGLLSKNCTKRRAAEPLRWFSFSGWLLVYIKFQRLWNSPGEYHL